MKTYWPATLCLLAILAAPRTADASPRQFDLICKGEAQIDDQQTGKDKKPFSDRLSVDLDQPLFCLHGCWHLTEADAAHIAYHYTPEVADRDHSANTYRWLSNSSAGPFELKEDVTVDLRTGDFQRLYVYEFGDIVSFHHETRYTGHCTFAPFTLEKREQN